MQIADIKAVVTGGASGLGEATVRAIVGKGGKAAIFDVNREKGEALAAELGENASFHAVDVTDERAVSAAIEAAGEAMGGLTMAVNCAGIAIAEKVVGRDGPHDLGRFRKVIDINLVGTFNVMRLAAALMAGNAPNADGERGVIVNTASIAALEGQKGQIAYAASKGGVAGMTLPAARDLAREGIRVNTIAPGLFETPMFEGLNDEAKAELAKDVLFPRRLGRPAEYAALVLFLAENTYMNGALVRIDGGIRLP